MFSEAESIGPNGTKAHGPNAVVSMLHHYFEVHSMHEESCHLHADNNYCVGQNKNRLPDVESSYWKEQYNYTIFHACGPHPLHGRRKFLAYQACLSP